MKTKTKVTYNGKEIAYTVGEVIDVHCGGKKMLTDMRIEVDGIETIVPDEPFTENKVYTAPEGKAFSQVEVAVKNTGKLQDKTVDVTANGTTVVTPDPPELSDGVEYGGMSSVTVNVAIEEYDGTVTMAD